MAKMVKKHSPRQGLFSKAINIAFTLFAFARPLHLLATASVRGGFLATANVSVREATFGLSDGKFDLKAGTAMYTPVAGAFALGTLMKFIRKKFPVR